MPNIIDKHDIERRNPVKWMCCTCCGNYYHGRQWHNQDTGHGLGDCCTEYVKKRWHEHDGSFEATYGIDGIHFNIEDKPK